MPWLRADLHPVSQHALACFILGAFGPVGLLGADAAGIGALLFEGVPDGHALGWLASCCAAFLPGHGCCCSEDAREVLHRV